MSTLHLHLSTPFLLPTLPMFSQPLVPETMMSSHTPYIIYISCASDHTVGSSLETENILIQYNF